MIDGFMFVFNGAATLELCLRNALKALGRMIIVEGAHQWYRNQSSDGRSTDETNQILDQLQSEYGKDRIVIIRKAGYWDNEDDMVNAAIPFLRRGYIWEIDADEFYYPHQMSAMARHLAWNQHYTAVEFWGYQFYGRFNMHAPIWRGCWGNTIPWRRIFKNEGMPWWSHEPPRLMHKGPEVVMDRDTSFRIVPGMMLYHYAYIYEGVIRRRITSASQRQEGWNPDNVEWFNRNLCEEIQHQHTLTHPVPFRGTHPIDVASFTPS